MVKISFIVPVYNQETYIVECIESLLKQTLSEIEILLVDNGSTDNSAQLCQQYTTDNRVRYFRLDKSGVGLARNFGLKKAKGLYIGFVDSDDYLHPEFARLMYKEAMIYNSVLCSCGIIKFNNYNNREDYFHIEANISETEFIKNHELCNPVWNKLFRRDIINKYHLRFAEDISYVEDYAFVILFYLLGKNHGSIAICPQLLYYYRQHNNSTMAKIYECLADRIVDLERNVIRITTTLDRHQLDNESYKLIKVGVFDYFLIELPLWLIKIALDEEIINDDKISAILTSYCKLYAKYRTKFTVYGQLTKSIAMFDINLQLLIKNILCKK